MTRFATMTTALASTTITFSDQWWRWKKSSRRSTRKNMGNRRWSGCLGSCTGIRSRSSCVHGKSKPNTEESSGEITPGTTVTWLLPPQQQGYRDRLPRPKVRCPHWVSPSPERQGGNQAKRTGRRQHPLRAVNSQWPCTQRRASSPKRHWRQERP